MNHLLQEVKASQIERKFVFDKTIDYTKDRMLIC